MNDFDPTPIELDIPILKSLAKKHGKTITVYDLETTNFVESPTFGITDVAAVHIHPNGITTKQTRMVNPEFPISPGAAEVTGISQSMVDNQPNWSDKIADSFLTWSSDHIMMGYNNLQFDDCGIISQNKRYKNVETKFEDSRDVRSAWRIMTRSGKGKLTDASTHYGINPEGAHRAIYDVIMTIKVLESMLNEAGVELFEHPGLKVSAKFAVENMFRSVPVSNENPNGWVNQEDRILQIIDVCGFTTVDRLAFMMDMDRRVCNNLLDTMIIDGRVDASLLQDEKAQQWLLERMPAVMDYAWLGANRGKYKPIFEALKTHMGLGTIPNHNNTNVVPAFVDYTQLKIFLKLRGYLAALDKETPVQSIQISQAEMTV